MIVAITGATGFIGRRVVQQLLSRHDLELVLLGRTRPCELPPGIGFERIDLLHPADVAEVFARVRPSHLIHLAWNATPTIFWTAADNLTWVSSSLTLLHAFQQYGGRRAVVAGSCAEYDWTGASILSEASPTQPATLYGASKDALRRCVDAANTYTGASIAWGRVFWLYGPGEPPGRLVSDICGALSARKEVAVGPGTEVRDFLHVDDVAAAFIAAMDGDWAGAFNVGSGDGVSVSYLIDQLGAISGRSDLIRIGARPAPANLAPKLVAKNDILKHSLGWKQSIPLEQGLASTYNWWLENSGSAIL